MGKRLAFRESPGVDRDNKECLQALTTDSAQRCFQLCDLRVRIAAIVDFEENL
jgi:hypothetical protein